MRCSPSIRRRTVTVHNRLTDEQYTESYDKLIVAPGAGPIRPPFSGMDPAKVFTLRNLEDTFRIKDYMTAQKPCDVAIVGGGYIGLEMAENMVNAGHRVHIIEAASHVITTLDADMAHILHNRIRAAGVDLRLGEKVVGFRDGGVALESGEIVPSNMTILSIGVRRRQSSCNRAALHLAHAVRFWLTNSSERLPRMSSRWVTPWR